MKTFYIKIKIQAETMNEAIAQHVKGEIIEVYEETKGDGSVNAVGFGYGS